jgi:hypothetical protein
MTTAPHPRSAPSARLPSCGRGHHYYEFGDMQRKGTDRQHGTEVNPAQENDQTAAVTSKYPAAVHDAGLPSAGPPSRGIPAEQRVTTTFPSSATFDIQPEWDHPRAAFEHPDQSCRYKYSAIWLTNGSQRPIAPAASSSVTRRTYG